jgi:hypothetical protein
MKDQKDLGTKIGAVVEQGRLPYSTPSIVRYGSVGSLTANGSGIDQENSGKDDENNMTKRP